MSLGVPNPGMSKTGKTRKDKHAYISWLPTTDPRETREHLDQVRQRHLALQAAMDQASGRCGVGLPCAAHGASPNQSKGTPPFFRHLLTCSN